MQRLRKRGTHKSSGNRQRRDARRDPPVDVAQLMMLHRAAYRRRNDDDQGRADGSLDVGVQQPDHRRHHHNPSPHAKQPAGNAAEKPDARRE